MMKHENFRKLSLTKLTFLPALISGIMISFSLVLLTSAAEPPTIETRIDITSDGEPTFNSANYGPGLDNEYGSSPTDPLAVDNTDFGNDISSNNGIVRNGDNVVYKIQVNLNGADANNVRSIVNLSGGHIWNTLPGKCRDGSTISADKKTLVCNLGYYRQGTVITFNAPAFVPMTTFNNSLISASVVSTADGANTAMANSSTTISTAAPKVNLVKTLLNNRRAYDVQDPDTGQMGKVITWGIGVYAEKGSEALDGLPISFTDVITYPFSSVIPSYKIYDWGSEPACGINSYETNSLPFGVSGVKPSANSTNSVLNTGTFICSQVGGQGTEVSLTVTGYDSSGNSVPTKMPDGTTISLDKNYFIAGYIDIWIPYSDFIDPANGNVGTYFLDIRNDYSTIDPNSISGQSNYGVGTEDSVDNGTNAGQTENTLGGWDRQLSFDGENSLMSKTGTVKSYAGGLVYPFARLSSSIEATLGNCIKIDTSELTMTGNFLEIGSQEMYLRARQILDRSPFIGSLSLGPDSIPNTADDGYLYDILFSETEPNSLGYSYGINYSNGSLFPHWKNVDDYNVRIEYSSVPVGDYQTDNCEDSVGIWVTDPTADTINFPNGWASVTRMRYFADFPGVTDTNTESHTLQIYPEFQINSALDPTAGGGFGNSAEPDAFISLYSSSIWVDDPNNIGWINSTIPSGINNPFDAGFVDRVEIMSAQLRTSKTITNLEPGAEVTPGDVVDYKLKTTFSGGVSATSNINLDDTLNSGLSYVPGTTVINPGDSGILVNGEDPASNPSIEPTISGQTLTWHLTNVPVGATLPEISYKAQVSIEATSGVFENIVVASEDNPVPIDTSSTQLERTSAQSVYLTSSGDYDVLKLLTNREETIVEKDEQLKFDLTYANTSASQDIHNLDFIEVFPFNGDAPRDPVSSYTDDTKLELVSITGSLGGENYLYTDADPATIKDDPCHVSNTKIGDPDPVVCPEGLVNDAGQTGQTATGVTNWYDCSGGFGTGACPIAQTDVTAIRIKISEPSPGTPALPAGLPRQSFSLVLQPHGNLGGDIYTNNFGSRVSELKLKAISNDVSITVVDSSLGDRLWLDKDGDGQQDADETGISGVTVRLYDSSNNLITETITDSNGNYLFDGLHSGDYYVTVDASTLPAGLTQTYDLDGLGSANRTDGSIGANTDVVTWDFGYSGVGKIGDTIWLDTNENGIQDASEAGIPNIPISITYYGSDGQLGGGDDITFNLVTDTNGKYLLEGIPYGDYSIKVNIDNTHKNTYDLDGNKDSLTMLTISSNSPENLNGDFGYVKKTSTEQMLTNITESITSIADKLANTGQNTKFIIVGAVILITGGAYIMVKRRK